MFQNPYESGRASFDGNGFFNPGIGVNPCGGLVRDALYFVLNQVQKLI
jgi:hypothetical protein